MVPLFKMPEPIQHLLDRFQIFTWFPLLTILSHGPLYLLCKTETTINISRCPKMSTPGKKHLLPLCKQKLAATKLLAHRSKPQWKWKNSVQTPSETDRVWFHILYSPITSQVCKLVCSLQTPLKQTSKISLCVIRVINSFKTQMIAK
jgi:hypothetical protein